MSFSLDDFVARARAAAAGPDALAATKALMRETFADPAAILAAMPAFEDDETVLFEDETVSIWHERFLHTEVLPPHDHQLDAVIGVYDGKERNALYRHCPEAGFMCERDIILTAGDTHVITPTDIHAVQALDGAPSLGLHVYLGPLTKVDRSLFCWETGTPTPMCDEQFVAMKRAACPNQ